MANSLQDQLVKAGLADARQAKKARVGKGLPAGKKGQRAKALSDSTLAARRAIAEKAERDRALNLERKAAAERKALAAQVRQLIEQNRLARDTAEEAYHFVDQGKVRSLLVTPVLREQLARRRVDIVRYGSRYELVPADVAERISSRDPACVVAHPTSEATPAEDDPYAAYQVPDDLMW